MPPAKSADAPFEPVRLANPAGARIVTAFTEAQATRLRARGWTPAPATKTKGSEPSKET